MGIDFTARKMTTPSLQARRGLYPNNYIVLSLLPSHDCSDIDIGILVFVAEERPCPSGSRQDEYLKT